jgi:hypothetical protein
MTTTDSARRFTDASLAAWAVTLLCTISLWMIGYWGPYLSMTLTAVSVLGGGILIGKALIGIRSGRGITLAVDLLIGLGAWSSASAFAHEVLSNEEGAVPTSGTTDYELEDWHGNRRPTPAKIRLFNLNVLHGFPDFEKQNDRFNDMAAELNRLNADILVFQEAWMTSKHGNMAERLAERLRFNFAYARANGSFYHIGFEEGRHSEPISDFRSAACSVETAATMVGKPHRLNYEPARGWRAMPDRGWRPRQLYVAR